VGDILEYNAPIGKFVFEDHLKNVVFIAGGSGISPFRGMIKYIFDKKIETNVTLIYGSRSPEDIILNDELHSYLKYENFRIYLTVDHPDDNWKFHSGFIDTNFLKEATDNIVKDKVYFIIGPPPMVNSVKTCLLKLGLPEEQVLIDAWG
jgi:NAD(P)H-flavin reductase